MHGDKYRIGSRQVLKTDCAGGDLGEGNVPASQSRLGVSFCFVCCHIDLARLREAKRHLMAATVNSRPRKSLTLPMPLHQASHLQAFSQ
jgi:hypothetical protein